MSTKCVAAAAVALVIAFSPFGISAASAADAVNVISAQQVTVGDGKIAVVGGFTVGPPNILLKITMTATKTDNPGSGQTTMRDGSPDPNNNAHWIGTLLVVNGTYDVTVVMKTMNPTTHVVTTTNGSTSILGVVVK